jgi:hypothetical protein
MELTLKSLYSTNLYNNKYGRKKKLGTNKSRKPIPHCEVMLFF